MTEKKTTEVTDAGAVEINETDLDQATGGIYVPFVPAENKYSPAPVTNQTPGINEWKLKPGDVRNQKV